MIIVDTALRKRAASKQPLRVGIIGAGAMARGVALQLTRFCAGFHLAGVSNRGIEKAVQLFRECNINTLQFPETQTAFDANTVNGLYSVTDNPALICQSAAIDVVVEITGSVDFGADVVIDAIAHDKHVVLMNAELDSTLGPLLKTYADKRERILTNVDGDQPGVLMNLYRFVKGIGIEPVLCGNIKGLQDPYRTPTTQKAFAERWKQSAPMVTSFADGTKISFEQALVANATGMRVARRGMLGPVVVDNEHIDNAHDWFPVDLENLQTGIVDYVVGASPAPGVFVIGKQLHPAQQHLLEMYKLGKGPLYTFYAPYHLCHFEVPNTIARAALFQDAAITAHHGPCVDVVATAKRRLHAGETLDGIGYYMTYGQCENADTVNAQGLLPMGLACGCVLLRDIDKDATLYLDDVQLPSQRRIDALRKEQDMLFFGASKIS